MVTKGCTSAYTTWLAMKNEGGEYVLSYKNVGKRVVRLVKHGILKEIKLKGVENLHGRKDYVVTTKGFELLIPYCLDHPQDIQSVVGYINKFEVDKYRFALLLKQGYVSTIEALNEYNKLTNSLYYPFGINGTNEIKEWYDKHWDVHEDNKKVHQKMMVALNRMTADQKIYEKIVVAQREMFEDIKSVEVDMNKLTDQFNAEAADKEEIDKIDETKKTLDETIAAANKAAKSFRQTVEDMKEAAPQTAEVIKRARERVKTSGKKTS